MRNRILRQRDGLHFEVRLEKSRKIVKNLQSASWFSTSRNVFSYVHFRSEVQTLECINKLLSRKIKVSVPVTLVAEKELLAVEITDPAKQLKPGYAGILEPNKERTTQAVLDASTIELALVPGSVFDRNGGRLGYGGGYYDRFFAEKAPQALRVGLAYEIQLVAEVPLEEHDKRMDYLVTEKAVYDCGRKRGA